MDSMRSLNTSLPSSSTSKRRKQTPYPPVSLHQAFKAAAFSVTQLYKAASADEGTARAAGYQDAVDDLLEFLDKENLGLDDGEGWRVRQWATERMTRDIYGSGSETDDAEDTVERSTAKVPGPSLDEAASRQEAMDEGVDGHNTGHGASLGSGDGEEVGVVKIQIQDQDQTPSQTGHDQDRDLGQDSKPSKTTDSVVTQEKISASSKTNPEIFHFTSHNASQPLFPPSPYPHSSTEMDTTNTPTTRSSPNKASHRPPARSQLSRLRRRSSLDRLLSNSISSSSPLSGNGPGSKRPHPSHFDFDFVNFASYGVGGPVLGNVKRLRRD